MTQTNNLPTPPINPALLGIRMLLGGGIALIVISMFIFGTGAPDPAWGKLWIIRPLIITPLAGASGGAFSYFVNRLSRQQGWEKILATVIGVIGFLIALWLGIILGLDGTLWD